ncbi:hypothetical protein LIPSTDRAFT_71459 [Lipomyces starkeyi NRRL Y-11557]|uniref:Origin recognition complex subunit 4 C-terminal domain-containing protein n=1 Tax=Lipomyces starkeyi NRRL Y-11557 TaxID=675824 RepID=A0A1E3Q6J7_LIPST|nr:hypothetical protein LIPSTDRAFT_71459 [Lipomyces starkeyi NRRL Y-11557]
MTTERRPAQNLARTSGSLASRADSNSMPAIDLNGHRKRSVSEDDQDEIAVAGLQTTQRRKRGRSQSKTSSVTVKPTLLQSVTARTAPVSALPESNAPSTTSTRSASSSPTPASRRTAKRARTNYTRRHETPIIRSHSLVPTSRSRKRQIANDEDEIDSLDRGRKDAVRIKLESARDSDAVEGEDTARRVMSKQLRLGSVTRKRGNSAVRLPTESSEDMHAGIRDDKREIPEIQDAEVGTSDPEEQDQDDHEYITGGNHEKGKVLIENGVQDIASGSSLELPAVVAEPQPMATALPISAPESTRPLTSPIVEKSINITSTSGTSISAISMDKIKRRVLAQLNGKLPVPIVGLDDAHKKIYNLLEQTILAPIFDVALASSKSESPSSLLSSTKFHGGNSALLLGPRASGKSLIISTALAELERKYKGQFIVVRLSGFAQTDDKQALQEIAAQMEYGIEALDEDDSLYDDLDDDVKESPTKIRYKRQNSSVALERLLSLFSGRAGVRDDNEEPLGEQQSQQQQPVVSVLIILEEFERFATMQNRQTLLYNLLDVAQSPRYSLKTDTPAPNICIIGVSSRMTAPEMLEKRVRSRFSHRVIVLPHVREVESFWRVCSSGLKVTSAPTVAMMAAMVNASKYTRVPTRLKKSEYTIERRATEVWNSYIDSMYSTSPEVRRVVDLAFATSRDPRQVHMQFLSAVRKADQMIPFVATSEIGGRGVDVLENAGIMEKVAGLSELSLMLLICAARAEIKYATTTSVPVSTLSPTKSGPISNTAEQHERVAECPPMVPNKSHIHSSQPVVTNVAPISFTLAYEEYLSQAGKTRLAEASAGALITMPFRVWSREQAVAAWEALERGGLVVNASEIGGSGSTGRSGSAISEMQVPEIGLMELGEIVKDMRGVNIVVRQWCSAL